MGFLLCMVLDDQFSLELTCRMEVQLAVAQGVVPVCVEVRRSFFFSGGDEHSALLAVMRLHGPQRAGEPGQHDASLV